MDKVIIDGVDVSECEYANACDKKLKCVILQDDVCEIDPYCEGYNCYYKQLKRLQAEYDDLHLSYAGCKTANTGLQELNEKLQAENERLKEELKEAYEHYNFKRIHNEVINAENLKYNQALQEIKQKLDRVMTEEFTISEEWKPFELIDECRNKINSVIGEE